MILFLAGLLLAPTPATPPEPVAACRSWIDSRSWADHETGPKTRILSEVAACFDGTIEEGALDRLHAWIDAVPAHGPPPVLVVRSRGGDARLALELAEKLQAKHTEVHATQVCASSCANYFYAGVARRHFAGPTLLLFHGGFSADSRARSLAMFDQLLAGPQGAMIRDPEANRRAIAQSIDSAMERQDNLYRRIGVDRHVVHGVDAVEAERLDAWRCGGGGQRPRNFLFFSAEQMERLGIAPASGAAIDTPETVNAAVARLEADFVACLAPDPVPSGAEPAP